MSADEKKAEPSQSRKEDDGEAYITFDRSSDKRSSLFLWWQQFSALMYRNWLLKLRKPWSSFFEIMLPVIVMIGVVGIRAGVSATDKPNELHLDRKLTFMPTTTAGGQYADLSTNMPGTTFPVGLQALAQYVGYTFAFVPNNAVTQQMQRDFEAAFPAFATQNPPTSIKSKIFESEGALEDYCKDADYAKSTEVPGIYGAIVLEQAGSGTPGGRTWKYTLRFNATGDGDQRPLEAIPNTFGVSFTNNLQIGLDSKYYSMFANYGATATQVWVERWMINQSTAFYPESMFDVQPFPTPAHTSDQFAEIMEAVLGLLFAFTYLWPVACLVSLLVEEKEKRIKEGMKIQGLNGSALFCSWFATYLIIFMVSAILITIATSFNVYDNSDGGTIFFFFFFFGISVFCFCYMIHVFFDTARVASTMGSIVFLVAFFPYFALNRDTQGGTRVLACLSSSICFGQAATVISYLESFDQGLTSSTISNDSIQGYSGFSVNDYFGMVFFDCVLYLFLAYYFEKTWKAQYGVKLPHCFCCRPSWCCGSKRGPEASDMHSLEPVATGRTIQAVPKSMESETGMRVRGLRKEFPPPEDAAAETPNFVAVKGLDMDMYRGQIFALLGHNGAGKSTSINMLTGLYPPTAGDAWIMNQSILNSLSEIRRDVGLCPQHDILYDDLTVEEHLKLFCAIKNVPSSLITPAIDEMIEAVGLTEKRHSKSGTLSGGQKRKLSVAIALIGGSKTVFLDEPTSGMDPYSRRSTWDLLRRGKKGRVLILTTHFMDEADQLGDRIAIMADGEVRCCGSPLFLKSLYGVGYTMTISKVERASEEQDKKLTKLVMGKIPKAELLSKAAGELSFRLPFAASKAFPELFTALDEDMKQSGRELAVDSYGISVTTLEEVFLRVARNEADSQQRAKDKETREKAKLIRTRSESRMTESRRSGSIKEQPLPPDLDDAEAPEAVEMKSADGKGVVVNVQEAEDKDKDDSSLAINKDLDVEYQSTLFIHFKAILIKRWHHAKRDRKVLFWTMIYPFLIMLAGVGLLAAGAAFEFADRNMNANNYNTPLQVPFNNVTNNMFPTNGTGLTPNTGAGGLDPFPVNGITSDVAMSQWLLDTFNANQNSRYGAYNFRSLSAAIANFTVFINTTSPYSLPVFYNLYSNMLLRQQSGGDSSAFIQCNLDPLPRTSDEQALQQSITAIFYSIGMSFVPAAFASFVVRERQVKAKHQQLISGISVLSYWSANFIWDFVNYMVPGLLALAIAAIYNVETLLGEGLAGAFVTILLFGLSVIPFTYLVSFAFNDHSSAQIVVFLLNFLTGSILFIVSIVLSAIESTRSAQEGLVWIFRLFPSYCFVESIASIIIRDAVAITGSRRGVWDLETVGWPMLFMALESVVYFGIVQLVEYILVTPELLSKMYSVENVEEKPYEDDKDVIAEAERVLSGAADNDMIRVKHLRKVYPGRLGGAPKLAVRDLSFGIPEGQCFGFLGINGAGKTTTLSILTADILPTSGEGYLAGQSIMTDQQSIRKLIGYCPQFDALIDTLTAREHLYFYARIKGMPEHMLGRFAARMIDQLGLAEYADKPCGGYSGGNKRKLSVGIALIGNPKIVFLDEPSTGMDPNARRFMWELISGTMAGRSVILTTHSMEEAEALCSRIGIMVGGRLRCLGSANHLKHRYGDGYQIDVNTGVHSIQAVKQFIKERLPGAKVIEKHPSSIKYRVGRNNPLGDLFEMIEENREQLNITEYSISETTLEQIFIHFAKQQEEETGAVGAFQVEEDPAKRTEDGGQVNRPLSPKGAATSDEAMHPSA